MNINHLFSLLIQTLAIYVANVKGCNRCDYSRISRRRDKFTGFVFIEINIKGFEPFVKSFYAKALKFYPFIPQIIQFKSSQ
ncbi:hypothetical protein B9T21_07450 [Wohlfahrtiimonas chitiniclastica]|nr:hypothetical protein B9T21_07450 [Wohlfahrtiimonas chitiniclastica]